MKIHQATYPSTRVFVDVKVALVVGCTWHQQTSVSKGVVIIRPLFTYPFVDHPLPGHHFIGAPARRHLHDMKYIDRYKYN
jgi:hypothetical protein